MRRAIAPTKPPCPTDDEHPIQTVTGGNGIDSRRDGCGGGLAYIRWLLLSCLQLAGCYGWALARQ